MISILFVDDERSVRENFEILLTHSGYVVELADSVAKALAVLKNREFDLIISDMRMAPQTGLDLLRAAKKIAPNTEVLILTGHGDIQNAIEAMKLGALDYITKDLDHREILLTIEKSVKKKFLRSFFLFSILNPRSLHQLSYTHYDMDQIQYQRKFFLLFGSSEWPKYKSIRISKCFGVPNFV